MKVKNVHWVSPGGMETQIIGIIETINSSGEKKIYAGIGQGLGSSEKDDVDRIVNGIKRDGGKIIPMQIDSMYRHLFGDKVGIWSKRDKVKIPANSRVVFADYDDIHKMCKKVWTAIVDPSGFHVDDDGFKMPVDTPDLKYTHFMVLPSVEK